MVDAAARTLQCVVVTPERTVFEATVNSVVLPMFDGELGVLPGRAPLIGRLGPGELRTRTGQEVRRFFVDGGFAQVRGNIVTVLTPRAQKAEDINTPAVKQALEAARARSRGVPLETQAKNQERARAQLRVAQHVHGSGTGGGH